MLGAVAFALGAGSVSPAFSTPEPAPGSATGFTQTRYPVVLVHGLFGFDDFGPVDYFFGIVQGLRAGGATVYTPAVSATNSNEERGEQLLRYLRALKAARGHAKFNIIGHSQGGTTARYVAAVAPELVASVTSVGTPHTGSKTADGVIALSAATGTTSVVGLLGTGAGTFIDALDGPPNRPQSFMAALRSLNTAGAARFNQRYPQGQPTAPCGDGPAVVKGVRYDSLGGTSVLTNPADISDPFLLATSVFFKTEQNDGLVGRCSNHWGTVLRDDYPWNHLDEINQVFGLRRIFSPDPVAVYRTQANRLKRFGL